MADNDGSGWEIFGILAAGLLALFVTIGAIQSFVDAKDISILQQQMYAVQQQASELQKAAHK